MSDRRDDSRVYSSYTICVSKKPLAAETAYPVQAASVQKRDEGKREETGIGQTKRTVPDVRTVERPTFIARPSRVKKPSAGAAVRDSS